MTQAMEGRRGIPAALKAIIIGLIFHIGSTMRLVIETATLKWDNRRELGHGFTIVTSIGMR